MQKRTYCFGCSLQLENIYSNCNKLGWHYPTKEFLMNAQDIVVETWGWLVKNQQWRKEHVQLVSYIGKKQKFMQHSILDKCHFTCHHPSCLQQNEAAKAHLKDEKALKEFV